MSVSVPIALCSWPLVVLLMFVVLLPRRAVLAGLIGGWLFLPVGGYDLPGPLDWSKPNVVGLSVLLGVVLFDGAKLFRFRPSWRDLPVIIFCLCPAASSVANGLNAAGDLATPVVQHVLGYGIPYWLGRAYFQKIPDVRGLALATFIGGLIYVPLCLYEIRMSPQLHSQVYGFHQHVFAQSRRSGGWRPVVFMQHGLAVGMWMTATSIVGIGLWRSRVVPQIAGLPVGWWVAVLVITTTLCKSSGALALLLVGTIILLVRKVLSPSWAMLVFASCVPAYMIVRTSGFAPAHTITSIAASVFPENRVGSLKSRLMQEDILAERVMRRPVFGWGPWGAFRTDYDSGNLVHATDGMWIITFGKFGLIGLAGLTLLLLLPAGSVAVRLPQKAWNTSDGVLCGTLALVLVLFMYDSLMNAMPNPVFVLLAGGLSSVMLGYEPIGALIQSPGSGVYVRRGGTIAPPNNKNC